VPGTTWRSSELPPGEYKWRVIAKDALGHSSVPSELRTFVRSAAAPLELPTWVEPRADVVVAPETRVALAWSNSAGAKSWELELDGVPSVVNEPRLETPALSEGAHVVRVRARGDNFRFSDWTEPLELFAGLPAVVRADVKLIGQLIRVRLFDAKDRPVEGAQPKLTVRAGSLAPVQLKDGAYEATWTPPAAGDDVLRVEEREFTFEQPVVSPVDPRFSVAIRAGGIFSGGAVASPSVGLGFTTRLPFFNRRLGVELRAGGYRAASSFQVGSTLVSAQAWLLPISLVLAWHQNLGEFQFKGGLGPALQLIWLQVGRDSSFAALAGGEAVVGLSRHLGPGRLEAEVGFTYSRLDSALARLNAGGVTVRLGYAFDF
jgi:hypothetical protein